VCFKETHRFALVSTADRADLHFMKQPTLFIPHGGGPCFFMNRNAPCDPMWQPMEAYLKTIIADLPERPSAILIVSGHWEEPLFTVHVGENPGLLFDYHGFPEHTYELRFDAPGVPSVARAAAALLNKAGFATAENATRGWDHGVFIPLMLALPDADIPVVQLSLRADLDPAAHIAAGRALAPLREKGVLIIGSGMSFHNMGVRGGQATASADQWDAAMTAAVTDPDPQARAARVGAWADLPNARFAHPREEHLLPLMVALGAGHDDTAVQTHHGHVLGWAITGYRFG
jgi:aromatic ring-opening dioxygenase catalytic subunit (LigB family)